MSHYTDLLDCVYSEEFGEPCVEWWAAIRENGYGVVWFKTPGVKGRMVRVHRVAWEALNGEIPEGMTIDHLCRNRACLNPLHMEVVTRGENVRRGGNAMKTTCPQGHPYDYERPDGARRCRRCDRAAELRRPPRTRAISG